MNDLSILANSALQQVKHTRDAYELAEARYNAGITDFITAIDARRAWLQAQRDWVSREGRLQNAYIVVNKSSGNTVVSGPVGMPVVK